MPAIPTVRASGVTADARRRDWKLEFATARKPLTPKSRPTVPRQPSPSRTSNGANRPTVTIEVIINASAIAGAMAADTDVVTIARAAVPPAKVRPSAARIHPTPVVGATDDTRASIGLTLLARRPATHAATVHTITAVGDGCRCRPDAGCQRERARKQALVLHGDRQATGEDQTGPDTDGGTEGCHEQSFERDHPPDLAWRGADCTEQGDIALPLLDEQREHPDQDERGDEHRDPSQRATDGDQADGRLRGVQELRLAPVVAGQRDHVLVRADLPVDRGGDVGGVGAVLDGDLDEVHIARVAVQLGRCGGG